ncbi:Pzf1p Ecym_2817 [Eremothecium cymbalariae DBVPG|uniref:Transcription factor IIIA n=1 Tax=Eremothecium cymbalariae (strain CBS 270.75 / DBVPG 7215 / KCTC 17166 / NRRL Y-17582) TaxID=931890 RepID=G8JQF0_ERECY|nr:Hypothetical protein Ecym_2817 [Eremothecium cymbalariae DBVPG\
MDASELLGGFTDIPLKEIRDITLSRSSSATSLYSLSSVLSTSSSCRRKNYFCDYEGCDKSFNRPSLLTEHQVSVHQGIKPYKCTECDRAFVKKSHLERHFFSHSDKKPFSCSKCGKGVTTRQQLARHEITHTKSFVCTWEGCNQAFYKHPQLRSHVLSVHEKTLTCGHCSKTFQRPYRLKNHISKHHNPNCETKYQCNFPLCTKAFKTWSTLQQHIKDDHPKLPCAICGKQCVGEVGLSMHMTIHDESLVLKNWKCSVCSDLSFAKKADLLAHYMDSHKNEIPSEILEPQIEDHPMADIEPPNSINVEHIKNDNGDLSLRKPKRKRQMSELASISNEVKVMKFIESGRSALTLLLNTAGKKWVCPYLGCSRVFKSVDKYETHTSKHKIHELKMKLLEDKKNGFKVIEAEKNSKKATAGGASSENATHNDYS